MALEVTHLKREFRFKKNGTNVTLPDPDPALSVEEVMQHYGGQYPELTTAVLDEPRVEGSTATFNVRTTVGTKA